MISRAVQSVAFTKASDVLLVTSNFGPVVIGAAPIPIASALASKLNKFVSVSPSILKSTFAPDSLNTVAPFILSPPVVDIACDPKSGLILEPAIAAEAFTLALLIAPSAISALAIVPLAAAVILP